MKATKERKPGKEKDFFPKPEPGKYRPQISTNFSCGAQPEPISVTLGGMPRLAAMLQEIGMKVLEQSVEDGEPLDIEPADCVFTGEIAIAVAAAKNGNSDIATRIQAIDCVVPEPLFDIADSLGSFTDENGVSRTIANADELAASHLLAASVTASKGATVEEVEQVTVEAENYVPFPLKIPKYLVPKELANHEDFVKAQVAIERSVSPTFFVRTKKNDWNSSMQKYCKKVEDSTIIGWIISHNGDLDKGRVSEKEEYLMSIGHIALRGKYPNLRRFAEHTTKDAILRKLGVIEIDTVFHLVDVQAKRCARSIGKLLAVVMPTKRTREITSEGDSSMLVSYTTERLESHGRAEEAALTHAFLGQFRNSVKKKQCHYRPSETWKSFARRWLASYILEQPTPYDVPT